jgi:hypothetical protein
VLLAVQVRIGRSTCRAAAAFELPVYAPRNGLRVETVEGNGMAEHRSGAGMSSHEPLPLQRPAGPTGSPAGVHTPPLGAF